MNVFYAPPAQRHDGTIELRGQEAVHAAKALRYRPGDRMMVVDGRGGWFEGEVQLADSNSVRMAIDEAATRTLPRPQVILGMGIIKKRDRLEFAVEKAVELGVKEIALFRSDHTVKQNVRMDRLQSIAVSAMKQSLQAWLPPVALYAGPDGCMDACSADENTLLVAHETEERMMGASPARGPATLLMVGPEGGFSDEEIDRMEQRGGQLVSLGTSRLRTETAALTFLSQFHYAAHHWSK